MPFAAGLRDSLQFRQTQLEGELSSGEDLRQVLSRDLLTVEAMAEGDLITSVLLLSADGKRLSHGAAPRLPKSFCDAVDGAEIGPCAGSCGTAAYLNQPVYVRDIATDPLWADWRDLALAHGLRSCWSTPIRDSNGQPIATFAIYRRTVGDPTRDEIESIEMIADHVAEAIMLARDVREEDRASRPNLKLVADNTGQPREVADPEARLLVLAERLQSKADDLDRLADLTDAEGAQTLKGASKLSRDLVEVIRRHLRDADEANPQ